MEADRAPLQRRTCIKGLLGSPDWGTDRGRTEANGSSLAPRRNSNWDSRRLRRLQSEEIYIVKLIIGGEIQTSREVRLSRRDETLVDLLIETGLSRNIAKTLVFLSKREETTSVEIEKATGLRQPEVSIAMQELRRRRWVDKRDIKKEGKGRPVHSYRLSVPWSEILAHIDREEQAKIDRIEANRKKLKTFA